jgi:hypothetical protein
MDEFFACLGIVSVITLVISLFMDEPKAIDDIHKNLRKLGVSPLEKGQKSPHKLIITDIKGDLATYPLDQENFFFTVAHFTPNCEAYVDYMLELWCLSPFMRGIGILLM